MYEITYTLGNIFIIHNGFVQHTHIMRDAIKMYLVIRADTLGYSITKFNYSIQLAAEELLITMQRNYNLR